MIHTDMKCDIIRWDPYLCPCKASGNELSIIRYIMVVKDGLSKNKNRKRQLCRNLCRTQYKRHMRTLSHVITLSPRGAWVGLVAVAVALHWSRRKHAHNINFSSKANSLFTYFSSFLLNSEYLPTINITKFILPHTANKKQR